MPRAKQQDPVEVPGADVVVHEQANGTTRRRAAPAGEKGAAAAAAEKAAAVTKGARPKQSDGLKEGAGPKEGAGLAGAGRKEGAGFKEGAGLRESVELTGAGLEGGIEIAGAEPKEGADLGGAAAAGPSVTSEAEKAKRHRPARGPKAQEQASRPKAMGREHDEARDLFLEHQRALLLAERSNYTRQAEELRAQAEALALEHEPGDVQFDEEGGEGGTANVDRELDLHLSAQAHAAVEEIDAAMDKIGLGTYGYCESCGNPIPAARLEALPHARLCVSCKSGGLTARRQ